jgi:hypothetical protein
MILLLITENSVGSEKNNVTGQIYLQPAATQGCKGRKINKSKLTVGYLPIKKKVSFM